MAELRILIFSFLLLLLVVVVAKWSFEVKVSVFDYVKYLVQMACKKSVGFDIGC